MPAGIGTGQDIERREERRCYASRTFVVLLLAKVLNLDRNEMLAVLTFGVLIDFDHLLAYPEYVQKAGWANALNVNATLGSGIQ
jgi:hypothetical protein